MKKDTDFNPDELENGEDVEFGVNDWKDEPESNVLQKARYRFKVKDIVPHIAQSSGNECAKVTLIVDGWKYITDFLIRCDSQRKKHQMSYKWRNFLRSLGFKNPNTKFTVKKSQIVGKEGLCDVSIKKDGTDNQIDGYSPIKEPNAPMTDVPLEEEVKEEKPKTEKPENKKEEVEDDEDL